MARYSLLVFAVAMAALTLVGLRVSAADEQLATADRLAAEGKLTEAAQAYREVVERDPDNAEAHARLGGMHLMLQQYSAAIESFQRAISLDGGQARAFVGMGMAYLHNGRHQLARAALERARSLRPELAMDIDPVLTWLDSRAGGEQGGAEE